jgi:hypothetical protein
MTRVGYSRCSSMGAACEKTDWNPRRRGSQFRRQKNHAPDRRGEGIPSNGEGMGSVWRGRNGMNIDMPEANFGERYISVRVGIADRVERDFRDTAECGDGYSWGILEISKRP